MKKSGVVLELNKNRATIMTNEAQFIVIRREPQMYIGQQVDLTRPVIKRPRFAKYYSLVRARAKLALTAFFIILSLSVYGYYRQNSVYAYVSADINPSIELAVNQKTHIISARNLNNDGLILLRGTNLKNVPVDKALSILVAKAEQQKYFNHGNGRFILISAVTAKASAKQPELVEKSIARLQPQLKRRNIRLQFIQSTPAQRKLALKNHLSMGRYALMMYANNNGHVIALNEARVGSISHLLDKAGIAKPGMVGKDRDFSGNPPSFKVRKLSDNKNANSPENANPQKSNGKDRLIPNRNGLQKTTASKMPGLDETISKGNLKKDDSGPDTVSPYTEENSLDPDGTISEEDLKKDDSGSDSTSHSSSTSSRSSSHGNNPAK